MEPPKTFGERVGYLRSCARDASDSAPACSEIDRFAGLHRGHVWQIEQGNAENPKAETVRALARTFGCTVGWLLNGEGDAPTADEVCAAVERARGSQRPVGADHTASDFTVAPDPAPPRPAALRVDRDPDFDQRPSLAPGGR